MNKTINTMFITLLVFAFIAEYTVKAVALTITVALYVMDAVRYVYNNQEDIRNTIGSYFVYEYIAPTRLMAPKYIRAAGIRNTLRYA